MAALSSTRIAALLEEYYPEPSDLLLGQLSAYLDLLLKWNERTNLTAIRSPEEIVRRHFGESLFVATHLPDCETLLDFGSGAGFPGLPIQLARPRLQVTLAESQHKKASFLREAVRTLGLATEVWGDRAESLERQFDVVALRAVDRPAEALAAACRKVRQGGSIAHLTGFAEEESGRLIPVPGADRSFLHLFHVEHR